MPDPVPSSSSSSSSSASPALRATLPLALALLLATSAASAAEELVDRIVAVVDEVPILRSDIERAIALGLVEPAPEEDDRALRRRVLDGLIAQRLRLREVERFTVGPGPVEQVEAQLATIRARFTSDQAFDARLAALGLDRAGLRQLLERQLRVLRYVEARLGPRVFVDLDDIQTYYDQTLVPALRAEGTAVPPIEEVREPIRTLLREIRLNQEIDLWTETLRQRADVVDLFDAPLEPLPPVVRRIE